MNYMFFCFPIFQIFAPFQRITKDNENVFIFSYVLNMFSSIAKWHTKRYIMFKCIYFFFHEIRFNLEKTDVRLGYFVRFLELQLNFDS